MCPGRGCTPADWKTSPASSASWPKRGRSGAMARRCCAGSGSRPFSPPPLPAPRLEQTADSSCRWLLKPRRGAGGAGIRFWQPGSSSYNPERYYLQEHIEGTPHAVLYVALPDRTICLGVTRQLVGETWLHAG